MVKIGGLGLMTDRLGPYELGPNDTPENGIYRADAIELMRALPKDSISAILTDPPYFLPAAHYQTRKRWPRSLADLSLLEHFFNGIFTESRRVLQATGLMAVFCDGQSYPVMYTKLYPLFDRLSDVVWDKGKIGMGRGIRRQHEWILMALPAGYEWHGWEPSVILTAPVRSEARHHPAEKPIGLMLRLCALVDHDNPVILDPFCGSGTTLAAAKGLGMRYLGCDVDPEYVNTARERVRMTQMPLFVLEPNQKEMQL